MAETTTGDGKSVEGKKADMKTIATAMMRLTFNLPDSDLRDLVGLDSHSYRAALVRLLCEAADYKDELSQEQTDVMMTSLGVLSYLGLSTTSFKRLEKLWASVQLDFKLEPDILAVVNKFMKRYLVGSAADSRAASGKVFPATQLASCCPPLCLKLQCQAIISQAAVEGKMVSYGVLMSEVLGSKVSPQLCLDEDLQIVANIANFIFWTVVVNKSQTTISGVGRVSNGVVLDYPGTAECDNYDLYVENSVLKMVSLQSFFELYETVANEKGLSYKDGGMSGLHPSNPFAKLPGILNIETGRLIHGPEILDWYYSYCWENDSQSFTYQVDMTEVMSGMMTAMVIANIPITVAVDSLGAKTPKGMNLLITYMDAVLGIKPTSKFKKQLESHLASKRPDRFPAVGRLQQKVGLVILSPWLHQMASVLSR